MNQKLEKIRDELAYLYANCRHGKFSSANSADWCLSKAGHIEGFNSAEPHIRQDEMDSFMRAMEQVLDTDTIIQVLKKMDEINIKNFCVKNSEDI